MRTKRKYEANILIPPESVQVQSAEWQAQHSPVVLEPKKIGKYVALIEALAEQRPLTGKKFQLTMREYARQGLPWMSKSDVISVYDQLCRDGIMKSDPEIRIHLQKKPTRSQAGVTVVTVLTKPYPCPGKCIFCPTDVRMPKSYLHDEPGAQRAERHGFDPFAQTDSRLTALEQIGHPTDKIELLILGGTWSSYTRKYQEWFVKRCFDAMNGEASETLEEAQRKNAAGVRRNVGLVVETRQDNIDENELRWMRYLGVTKVQVGIQSLNEHILAINKRGHDVQSTRDAFKLLRLGGFKIHGHWMANLLGATVESDIEDYGRIWADKSIRPDELKLYPCMLVENAELYDYYLRGEYQPYTEEEVLEVLVQTMPITPRYVRLNRVIRDFPTTNVVEGNKKANLRQIAQREIKKRGLTLEDIRFREIRRDKVTWDDLELRIETYETDGTIEHFMSYETDDNRLAGFLRLSLSPIKTGLIPLKSWKITP
ncbi:MAG: tRNA uridine(34) 5-carboxymethylaminomethyl modification radical SAM/GNAT enzyme Elp3 [Chloroflexota bacterium]